MKSRRTIIIVAAAVVAVAMALPQIGRAHDKDKDKAIAPHDAVVDFGSPQPQPAPPASHILVPDETTISKRGTVTFFVNGGGHGVSIYRVSKNTVRQDIEEDLCQGGPTVCNAAALTQNARYLITDGKGDLIIDTGINPPQNRVNDLTTILQGAGAGAFLTGSTATTAGTQVTYRFEKTGRFLVICMNRSHSLNDWMFGFVTVVGDGDDDN